MNVYVPKFTSLLTLLFIFHLSLPFLSFASTLQSYDRQVLLKIQDHLGGPNPRFWNSSSSECCDFCTDTPVSCDGNGHVSRLTLDSSLGISGVIPLAVANLTELRYLTVTGLGFTGQIPSVIGKLTNLVELTIKKTKVTGQIPDALGRLTSLTTLDLSNNMLTGHIPYALGQLTNLNFFDLSSNGLSGPIPDSLGKLKNLLALTINNNKLTGSVPSSLSQLATLESLTLGSNMLSGSIPDFLDKLPNFAQLDLSSNMFSGSLPASLGNLSNLDRLILDSNRITGQIPTWICNLKSTSVISLHSNQLSGPIPDCSWYHHDTYDLYLSNNKLSGIVPKSLAIASLVTIDLSNNKLTDASHLFESDQGGWLNLDISNNVLKFNFTNAFFPDEQRKLNISHNTIYGSLPQELGRMPQGSSLDVSYNQLCGRIPNSPVLAQMSPANFEHNKCLCGAPLPPCTAEVGATIVILKTPPSQNVKYICKIDKMY